MRLRLPSGWFGARWLIRLGLPALIAMLVTWGLATGESPRYYHGGALIHAILAVFIIAIAMEPGPLRTVLGCRPLAWVGKLSYGLYLFHWPIIVWLVPSRLDLAPLTLNIVRIAITFAAATASFYLIEVPIRERRFLARRSRPVSSRGAMRRARPEQPSRRRRDAAPWLALPAFGVILALVLASTTGAGPRPNYLAGSTTPPSYAVGPSAAGASTGDGTATSGGDPVTGAVRDANQPTYSDAERPSQLKGVIWDLGDPLFCGNPPPDEDFQTVEAARRLGRPKAPASAAGTRILVLGDSTACSVFPGLRAVAAQADIAVEQGAVFGCGMVTAQPTSVRGDQVTPHAERCPIMAREAQDRAVTQVGPQIILWMSTWEKSDLIIDGKVFESGTPEGDAAMLEQMDQTLARITIGGAHVVLVTSAAPAPNDAELTDGAKRKIADEGYARLNTIQRRFARRHPSQVTLIDLASRLCPGGPPCPDEVNGVLARPDGRHFTPASSAIESHWLLPRILTAAR